MQFSAGQRNLAIRAMDEAEEHTLRYYCIPPYRWQQLNYDLLTRRDCEWEPLPQNALARTQRLRHFRDPKRPGYDFFRIQLNDPRILQAAHREGIGGDIYPFLVYILTHEMVHLVRLSTILSEHEALSAEAEEHRVQRIAFRILNHAAGSRLDPIFSRFSPIESVDELGNAYERV